MSIRISRGTQIYGGYVNLEGLQVKVPSPSYLYSPFGTGDGTRGTGMQVERWSVEVL